jgi:hypothetical protein
MTNDEMSGGGAGIPSDVASRHSSFVIRHSRAPARPIRAENTRPPKHNAMKKLADKAGESGKLGWIFLWLLGVPIPVLIILYLLRGCT